MLVQGSENLSVRCIRLYFLIMSGTCFRVNTHSLFAWMSRNSLLKTNIKFNWLQQDSNPQLLSLWTNSQQFSKTLQIILLICEYLTLRIIWLHVFITSCTHFRVNPHSIVAWMSKNFLLRTGVKSEVTATATGLEPKSI